MQMFMHRYFKRFVSLLLIIIMSGTVIPVMEQNTVNAAENVASFTRQTINFNREWKFVRDNVEGAEQENYNDSSWYNVGLPHDFSIPYWQEEKHYTGYGWYRKDFDVKKEWIGKHLTLDFAGVFHTAEVYVNGQFAGEHEGGYTGFEIDISGFVREGSNTVAVCVNNIWKDYLAPRAGEHMFTGGIYRDVNLVITSPVHVSWYGTFVQTPDINAERSNVRVLAEIANNSGASQTVSVTHTVYDADKKAVASIDSGNVQIASNTTYEFDNTSGYIQNINLWSPENPYLYSVHTDVHVNGQSVDQYDTTFGFRWFEFDKDEGFFLNGEHYWIDGANAHQDHAGWANAVTAEALKRDVSMIKESGLNFIRGSHYPHSPAYADACDELGVLFWSEAAFWCTAAYGEGSQNGTSEDYKADGYPTTGNKATEEAFEQSCIDCLTEMIRINRNHPSIIVWSMGNEPFFGSNAEKKKKLISKMAGVAKELDNTRYTAIGGTQRGEFDHLPNVDIAGYNGDGASMPEYQDPQVANLVAEYSSHTGNRPDKYTAYYGSVQVDDNNEAIRYPWRSGIALWCAFHHGSIMARSYGDMGYIDYYRLPLNTWYYYRYNRTGTEPEFSQEGTPARLSLSASDTTIKNDGTSDTHIIVTVTDDEGNWLNSEPEVTLEVIEGPGLFPTGKTMTFKPGDSMRDGKAAIEFRSYYAGVTTIEAYSASNPELEPATIQITTVGEGSVDEPDITTMYGAFMSNGGYVPNSIEEPSAYKYHSFNGCPMNASSGLETVQNVQDGDDFTSWTASASGSNQWLNMEIEHGGINLYKARLTFNGKVYPYKIQYKAVNISDEEWITIKEYDSNTINLRPYEESFGGTYMRYIRIEFTDVPQNEYANIGEIKLYGIRADQDGYEVGIRNLSDKSEDIECETNSELVYDLENNAKNYARFQSDIIFDSQTELKSPVKVSVYCDEELMFEKTISNPDDVTSIDISVNKVKALKLCAASDTEGIAFKWSNARLIGALRDISVSQSRVNTQICSGMDPLIPGEKLTMQARFENKAEEKAELGLAQVLYSADGTALAADITAVSVPGKGNKVINLNMDIPADIEKLSYVKIMAWNKDTLMPVTEDAYIFNETGAVGAAAAGLRNDAGLLSAIKDAMNIIYSGDADRYTSDSRKGYTEALVKGSAVLNDASLPQSDVDSAENAIRNAIAGLKLKTTVSDDTVTIPADQAAQPYTQGINDAIKKGGIYKAGKYRYKVLKVSDKTVNVSLYRPVSKKMKTAVIPAAVKIKGRSCKVTAVSAKAFMNNKKLKKVVVGKNVTKIGKKAFFKTPGLSLVTVKSTRLKKVYKNTFRKSSKKLIVRAPEKKLKAYKKLMKNVKVR